MSSWNDVIAEHSTGELEYTFPSSQSVTLKMYAKMGGGDYIGESVLRLTDDISHYLQLEGSSADTLKLVEYPGENLLVDEILIQQSDWQQIVIIISPSQASFYQNGQLVGSGVLNDPLDFKSLIFYPNQAQLYDELMHLPATVTATQVERWYWQEWPSITADPGGRYQEQYATGTKQEPTGEWQETPPEIGDGEYLWMRRRWVDGEGTPEEWSIPVRIKGDKGTAAVTLGVYQNYNADLEEIENGTLSFYGFDADGVVTEIGVVFWDSANIAIPPDPLHIDADGVWYILYDLDTDVLVACRWNFDIGSFVDDEGEEIPRGFFFARAIVKNEAIQEVEIYPRGLTVADTIGVRTRDSLRYLSRSIDSQDFEKIANNLGIREYYSALAVYDLFVNTLAANQAFINSLFAKDIEILENGVIHSGFTKEGDPPTDLKTGFWLSALGKFKAQEAEIYGRVSTGIGASRNARLAAKDETGVSGVDFIPDNPSDPGRDNMSIVDYGAVAGEFDVEIHSINNEVTQQIEQFYNIGGIGPGGGRIFYDKGNWDGGWR